MPSNKDNWADIIQKGKVLENIIWLALQWYILTILTDHVQHIEKLEKMTAVKDAIRYFTDDGHVIDLFWMSANTHDPTSHTPDFIMAIDSQVLVVIEAKNWADPPNTTRTKLYILTRFESYSTAPYKLLVITAPLEPVAEPLVIQEKIIPIIVPPQVLSRTKESRRRIAEALWIKLPHRLEVT